MPDNRNLRTISPGSQSWRHYQTSLKRRAILHRRFRSIPKFLALVLFCLAGLYGVVFGVKVVLPPWEKNPAPSLNEKNKPEAALLKKDHIQSILESSRLFNLSESFLKIPSDSGALDVKTNIDKQLQKFLISRLDTRNARYIAIVVMDSLSGEIQAMVGYNRLKPDHNPCLQSHFPAASIFKIITAAAAIEKCGFNPATRMKFNGGKYTLYKSQITDKTNRYTHRISFRDSFAQSVNPVFGKIGALYLGKAVLEEYALAFGFNRPINFELQIEHSHAPVSEDPYQWAEMASGFNRKTLISPIHGAMLSAAVCNGGQLIEPTVIDQIQAASGNLIYQGRPVKISTAVSPKTSAMLSDMMKETVRSGTSKAFFRNYRKHPILCKLDIGAKTGSINNRAHDVRLDWFVGFAEEKRGNKKISVSVLVAHEKYIGTRAGQYARLAIEQYYKSYFAQSAQGKKASGA